MELSSKAYNLSMNELLVLLALKGADKLYGVFDKDFEVPKDAEVHKTVFNMGKKGIVDCDDSFIIREEIDALIGEIKNARYLLVAASHDDAVRDQVIYIGKRCVLLRFTGIENERIRIEEIPDDEIGRHLFESEWMIKNNTSDTIVGDGLIKGSELGSGLFEKSKAEIFVNQEVKTAILLMEIESSRKLAQLTMIEEGLEDYIVLDDGESRSVYQYSDTGFITLVMDMINTTKGRIE